MSATGRSPVRLDQDAYQTPGYCVDKLLPWLDLNGRDGEPLTFFEPCRGDGAIYDRLPAEARKGPTLRFAVDGTIPPWAGVGFVEDAS